MGKHVSFASLTVDVICEFYHTDCLGGPLWISTRSHRDISHSEYLHYCTYLPYFILPNAYYSKLFLGDSEEPPMYTSSVRKEFLRDFPIH